MIYIPASTDLASFELHSLFFDYISMHMAEGRDEGNNHPVSSAVDTLLSHFTDLTHTEANKFFQHGTELACVYGYVMRHLKGSSASKML